MRRCGHDGDVRHGASGDSAPFVRKLEHGKDLHSHSNESPRSKIRSSSTVRCAVPCSTVASSAPKNAPKRPTTGSKRRKTSRFRYFSVEGGVLGAPKCLLRRKWPRRIVQELRSGRRPGTGTPEIDENTVSDRRLRTREGVSLRIECARRCRTRQRLRRHAGGSRRCSSRHFCTTLLHVIRKLLRRLSQNLQIPYDSVDDQLIALEVLKRPTVDVPPDSADRLQHVFQVHAEVTQRPGPL